MVTLNFPSGSAYGALYDKYKWDGEKWVLASGGRMSPTPEAVAFLARTSGLDAAHTVAYGALIDGLVLDGLWSKFDWLHIYATNNSTHALLNLISTSYPGVVTGTPTFTADRGYTGVDGSSTVYINPGFNPVTAPSPKFTLSNAHMSVWSLTDMQSGCALGVSSTLFGPESTLYPRTGGAAYFRIGSNDHGGITVADSVGHYVSVRNGGNWVGYKGGVSIGGASNGTSSLVNHPMYVLARNANGTAASGSGHRIAMASMGSLMSAAEVLLYYTRLRSYLTAVGAL